METPGPVQTENEKQIMEGVKVLAPFVIVAVTFSLFAGAVGYYKGWQAQNLWLCTYTLKDVVGPNVLEKTTWKWNVDNRFSGKEPNITVIYSNHTNFLNNCSTLCRPLGT